MNKIVLLFAVLTLGAGCNRYHQLLSSEKAMYSRISRGSQLSASQKMDSLLASGTRVMEAALKPVNPKQGAKIIERYYLDNQGAMQGIVQSIGRDFEKMNLVEQGTFLLKMTQSKEVKHFAVLYPKFKKKYRQARAAAGFLDFMGKGLGRFGRLSDLLMGGKG